MPLTYSSTRASGPHGYSICTSSRVRDSNRDARSLVDARAVQNRHPMEKGHRARLQAIALSDPHGYSIRTSSLVPDSAATAGRCGSLHPSTIET